jgi:hypothetical protein
VRNIGDIASTIGSVITTGANAADFGSNAIGCAGTVLAPGATCTVTVTFQPSAAGARTAVLQAAGSGGTSASASLRGAGRFDAELELTPEVANPGDVVTIMGSGYPPAATIELTVAIGQSPLLATTDGSGRFNASWWIMSGSTPGPSPVDDVAVPDVYDAAPVELVVVGSPMRPQASANLVRTIRNHVQR